MPEQPRLLMLTHRFPYPPDRGDRIRSYNLLKVLAKEFRVTLGATTNEPVSESNRKHVEELCQQVVIDKPSKIKRMLSVANSLLHKKSLTQGMFSSAALHQQIHQLHQDNPFDAVLIFCSSMFPYVDSPVFRSVPMVVDLVDVDSCKWHQMSRETRFPKNRIFQREAIKVKELEQRIADIADSITLVSDDEATVYRETINVPKSRQVVGVSNGVDSDYFDPVLVDGNSTRLDSRPLHTDQGTSLIDEAPHSIERDDRASGGTNPLRLVFTGVLDYHPNVAGLDWFCREVLPELQKQIAVSLKIVGRSPNALVLSFNKLEGVEVVGPVPDVRPYLAAADVAISPLKLARGIQNKVLEAMAMARPVVCTSPSAEGIAGVDGIHFMIADSVDEWCAALAELQRQPQRQTSLSRAARQLVVESYSWPAKLRPMVELLQPQRERRTTAEVPEKHEVDSHPEKHMGSSVE